MLRLLSILLVLAGLAAVSYGGYRYLQEDGATESVASEDFNVEVAAVEEDAIIVLEESAAPMPAFEAPPKTAATRSLSIPGAEDAAEKILGPETVQEDFLSTLQMVPIAHETPTSAQFGRAFEVSVAIDATGGDSAADALPGRGEIVESKAQVSADVRATLSGDQFEIEAVTPVIQTVSPIQENVWRWNVTPLESGAHDLTIELFALNGDRALPVRTFRDEVEVNVSRIGQVIATANSFSPIAVVIGGIGSLLAGLLGVLRIFRRS